MTTEPQPNTEGEWIPRYFSDFRREFDSFKDGECGVSMRSCQSVSLRWRLA